MSGEESLTEEGELFAVDGAPDDVLDGDADSADSVEASRRHPKESSFRERNVSLLPDSWRVQLPTFDGPLDLLLHLIKLNELEIQDIPVALVCDQFHAYLQLMEELDLDIAAEFIYEAALLIQLKSRLLLPKPKSDEDEPEEDPREVLVQRLLEYQRLKEAAQELAEVERLRLGMWTRDAEPPKVSDDQEEAMDLGDLSLFDLMKALKTVLDRYDREHPPPMHLRGESYSVRDQVHRLLQRLDPGRPLDLLDDLRSLSCRSEAVAAFLAVLELTKLSLLRLHQTESGELLLYRTTRETDAAELATIQG
ncbi:MAG: segregation/condensation protein A [Acidobacteriota bacterium]